MNEVMTLISVDNECVDCGLPCMYEACPYYKVVRFYCDGCDEEQFNLWHFDGQELCQECILNRLDKVEYEG